MTVAEHSMLQIVGPDGSMDFNVDPADEMFRITVGGKTMRFKRIDLFAITFAMSDPDQQADLMPVRKTEVMTYKRIHNIKVTKHLKPGDMIKCKCEMNVEKQVVEALGGIIRKQEDRGGIPIIGSGLTKTL